MGAHLTEPDPPPVLPYRSAASAVPNVAVHRRRTDRLGLRVTNAIITGIGVVLVVPCAVVAVAASMAGREAALMAFLCGVIPGVFGLVLIVAGAIGYRRAVSADESPV